MAPFCYVIKNHYWYIISCKLLYTYNTYVVEVMCVEMQKIRIEQMYPSDNRYTNYKEEILGYGLSFLQRFTATEGQTSFMLSRNYVVGDNKMKVFVNGVKMNKESDYEETSSNTITFLYPLVEDDIVRVRMEAVGGELTRTPHRHVADEVPPESTNDSNVIFTIGFVPIVNSECVFKNGVLLSPGAQNDYTISGNTVTFTRAPKSGSKITFSYLY